LNQILGWDAQLNGLKDQAQRVKTGTEAQRQKAQRVEDPWDAQQTGI
jgi:hypothetical protein